VPSVSSPHELLGLVAMVVLASAPSGCGFSPYGLMLVPFLLTLFLFGIALGILGIALVCGSGPRRVARLAHPRRRTPFAAVFYPRWRPYPPGCSGFSTCCPVPCCSEGCGRSWGEAAHFGKRAPVGPRSLRALHPAGAHVVFRMGLPGSSCGRAVGGRYKAESSA